MATDAHTLREGFGDHGHDLSRFVTRAERHSADSGFWEELYLLRRYLFTLHAQGLLEFPLELEKSESPDFTGELRGASYGIEVTLATHPSDQREMTLMDRSGEPALLGTFGGRYPHGIRYDGDPKGRLPDRDVTADVLVAIRRKSRKARLPTPNKRSLSRVDLLIYANSNASHMSDLETALPLLGQRLRRWVPPLTRGTSFQRIAVILGLRFTIYDARDGVVSEFPIVDRI